MSSSVNDPSPKRIISTLLDKYLNDDNDECVKSLEYKIAIVTWFSFKDKLLQLRMKQTTDGSKTMSTLPTNEFSHYIIMNPIVRLGERINQYKKNTNLTNSINRLNTFWARTNNVIQNLNVFLHF